MNVLNTHKMLLLAVPVFFMAQNALADEAADTRAMLEALQQQIRVLSAELRTMQEQMTSRYGVSSNTENECRHVSSLTPPHPTVGESENVSLHDANVDVREEKTAAKGQSKGEPVYASFKDGLVLDDASGDWSFQPYGRIQADYRNIAPTQWKNDTFDVRRARLGVNFTAYRDFVVRVEGEFANSNDGAKGTTGMTYGYVEYNHFPGARLRAGQFKPVFGLERAKSTNFTDFTELSLAGENGPVFNSTYDRGLMLYGAPFKGAYYNLSYVNGSGQNNDALKDSKDIVGRFTANIADWSEWKNSVAHFGVSASKNQLVPSTSPAAGAVYSTALSAYTESNGFTSNTAGNVGTTATKFFASDAFAGNVNKKRTGVETALSFGRVKFQGEYIATDFDPAMAVRKSINASYVSLVWMTTGENYADAYKNGMFNRIYPKQNFSLNNPGFGAVELGLRYSSFDATDFRTTAQGCKAGSGCLAASTAIASYANKADAWTAGMKLILTSNARLMANYVITRFNTPIMVNGKRSDKEDAVNLRAQYDF